MRARFINEVMNFERGKGSLKDLGVGKHALIKNWVKNNNLEFKVIIDDNDIIVIPEHIDIYDAISRIKTVPSYIKIDIKPNDSLLRKCVMYDNLDLIKSFINIESVVNKGFADTGNTALHLAVKTDNLEIIKFLVNHGADINIENFELESSLELAKKLHRYDIIEYLENLP